MPLFTSGGQGAAPPGERAEQGQWGRKTRSSTENKRERRTPAQTVEGAPSTLLAEGSGIMALTVFLPN